MSDITYIGNTNTPRRPSLRFGIKAADRRRHIYCLGKTGVGKSTLLRNLLVQDIAAGRGVGLIDPHGDHAEELLNYIPPHRTNDVVYLDPSDTAHPVGFNLLQSVEPDRRPLVASHVLSAFKSVWSDSWGTRLEYILYNAVLALLSVEGSTILGIPRLLSDEVYRARVVARITDPVVRSYWLDEFPAYAKSYRSEAIGPILNKVGQLLTSAPLRNILGQKRSAFSPRVTMDSGKIFIANLAKGKIGTEKANLLGSLLVASFQLAAMERAEVPEHKRRDFFLCIDEFHTLTTDSFTAIMSEARKYRLCLTVAHQHLEQLSKDVQRAVFGNVGTMIAFQLGHYDAGHLAREFSLFSPDDFMNLERFEIYVRLTIDDTVSHPFSATSLPPIREGRYSRGRQIIRQSQERFGTPRAVIEDEIARLHQRPQREVYV